jgi:membrane associated rhomboid family serine protease
MRLVGEYAVPEKKPAPAPEPPAAPRGALAAVHLTGLFALAWVALFAPFFPNAVAPRQGLLALGAVQPERIAAGEWWRLVGAQGLHADVAHLLGNLLFLILLMPSLARRFGAGRAAFLALASGAAGFLVSAWNLPAHGTSVGGSATVFAIVGALAADRVRAAWGKKLPGKTLLRLGGASLALAIMGDGNTDFAAHLGGLGAGALLALAVGAPGPAPALGQRLLSATLGLLALAGAAWALAQAARALV